MHPDNLGCLRAARPDVCILANNHVLDYGPKGLVETLETLGQASISAVGAGRNREEATRPVAHALPGGQHLITRASATMWRSTSAREDVSGPSIIAVKRSSARSKGDHDGQAFCA
jgi:poly-gamma-glutamate capsule biosynthesis protein CapA/YwtB (metallophosphatase superfamily)